jgi:hypothetical protein
MSIAELILRIRPVELAELVKKLCPIRRVEVRAGEFTLWVDPASNFASRVVSRDGYEPTTARLVRENLREGDVFVDLGANEGLHPQQLAAVGQSTDAVKDLLESAGYQVVAAGEDWGLWTWGG